MKLKEIFPHLDLDKKIEGSIVKGISDDSRLLTEDEIFFLIKRENFDVFSVLKEVDQKASFLVADLRKK